MHRKYFHEYATIMPSGIRFFLMFCSFLVPLSRYSEDLLNIREFFAVFTDVPEINCRRQKAFFFWTENST